MKLGCRRIYHKDKGQAAIRHYANFREPSFQALADIPPSVARLAKYLGGGSGQKVNMPRCPTILFRVAGQLGTEPWPGHRQQRATAEDAT